MFLPGFKYGFRLVSEFARVRHDGRRVTVSDLRRRCGSEVPIFNNVIFRLSRSGWVDNGDYPALAVDLGDGKSLFDLADVSVTLR